MVKTHTKRLFILFGLIVLIVLILISVIEIAGKLKQKSIESENRILHLINLDGRGLVLDLNNSELILLLFFNSECDLCVNELNEIFSEYESFNETQIYLISRQDIHEIEQVNLEYQLAEYPNIKIFKLDSQLTLEPFLSAPNPSTYLFAEGGELLLSNYGYMPMWKLKRYLNDDREN
jgi:hypothetical protein